MDLVRQNATSGASGTASARPAETSVAETSVAETSSAATIVEKARRYTMFEWGSQAIDPLPIAKAKGVYLYGPNGEQYLDFSSIAMNVNIGHGDPRVAAAIAQQLAEVEFVSPMMATEVRGALGEHLARVTPPGMTKSFFTLAGADANEVAIRTARLVTGKRKILTRMRSYHGGTQAVLAASGDPRRVLAEPGMGDVVRIPDPYLYRSPWFDDPYKFRDFNLSQIEEIIQLEGPATIAAVMVEPVTGSNGIIVPPAGWLKALRQLCSSYGILLICDEVMTGFGRTGKWFAVDHEGVTPDLLTMAKGLTSGYLPLGACVFSDAIAEQLADVPIGSGLTYQSHPVCLAAGRAMLKIYEDDDLIDHSAKMGEHLMTGLQALKQAHPSVGDCRGIGLFAALELVHDPVTKEELFPLSGPTLPEAAEMRRFLVDHGVLVSLRGPFLMIAPPLIISPDEIDHGLEVIDQALLIADRATSSRGAPRPPHTSSSPGIARWSSR